MERKICGQLVRRKNNQDLNPLILKGARQVGKTYVVNYFAEKVDANSAYCNFEKDKKLVEFFYDLTSSSIITKIALYKRKEILEGSTLVIFDEIQDCPEAITSLKYFNEEVNGYHIIALGSLIGVSENRGSSPIFYGKCSATMALS